MVETGEGLPNKEKASNKAAYLKILGLREMPDSPADVPDEIVIPLSFFSGGGEIIKKAHLEKREYSWFVNAGPVEGSYDTGKPLQGYKDRTGFRESLRSLSKALFGKEPSLASFHYHPGGGSLWKDDLANFISKQRLGYMFFASTDYGFSVFLQTEKSMKMPISSTLKSLEVDFSEGGRELPKLAEKFGLAFYSWEVRGGYSDLLDSLSDQQSVGGLVFKRIAD